MTIRPLTPLEISSGLVLPPARRAPALPALEPSTTPRAAFEAAIRPALRPFPWAPTGYASAASTAPPSSW